MSAQHCDALSSSSVVNNMIQEDAENILWARKSLGEAILM